MRLRQSTSGLASIFETRSPPLHFQLRSRTRSAVAYMRLWRQSCWEGDFPSDGKAHRKKWRKVLLLSPSLKNLAFPRVFRILGHLLWLSGAPRRTRCMASCGVAFPLARPKSSHVSNRASRQNTGVLHVPLWPRSAPIV
jgi:hypothetical protein